MIILKLKDIWADVWCINNAFLFSVFWETPLETGRIWFNSRLLKTSNYIKRFSSLSQLVLWKFMNISGEVSIYLFMIHLLKFYILVSLLLLIYGTLININRIHLASACWIGLAFQFQLPCWSTFCNMQSRLGLRNSVKLWCRFWRY